MATLTSLNLQKLAKLGVEMHGRRVRVLAIFHGETIRRFYRIEVKPKYPAYDDREICLHPSKGGTVASSRLSCQSVTYRIGAPLYREAVVTAKALSAAIAYRELSERLP